MRCLCQNRRVRRPLRPWLLITPLSALGLLLGHKLAYSLTGTPQEQFHQYLNHLPEIGLVLALLALVGASFVERGSRIALWPFPAVAITGFVLQEHVERLTHTGAVPFMFDKPVFLIGLCIQLVVAIAAWFCARLLLRIVGSNKSRRRIFASPLGEIVSCFVACPDSRVLATAARPRAPPCDR